MTETERRRLLLRIGLLLAAFAVLALLTAPNDAPDWETDVVDLATRLPDAVGLPVRGIMQLGTRIGVVLVAAALYLVTRRTPPAVAVLVTGIVVGPTNRGLKELITRDRPTEVRIREQLETYGLPSGHSAMAFALAATAAAYLPRRWRWVPYALAAVVGVGRMHVGAHFPLDVVGGALWGLAVGWTVVALPWFRPPSAPSVEETDVTDGT